MARTPDFIGLGVQKAGTSWIYSCLYEHPQICMPLKEVHFFSRARTWEKGYEWYENIFTPCSRDVKAGEFSTSYLVEPCIAERIYRRYPSVNLIASLRNPVDRAYSNYMNDIKSGVVSQSIPFEKALDAHPEYLEQGRYAAQLQHYLSLFPKEQLLLLVYEDCLQRPLEFIQSIYTFLEVDSHFVPSMLDKKVNVSTMPRSVLLERGLIRLAKLVHRTGFRHLWWFAKKLGAANYIRQLNTSRTDKSRQEHPKEAWRKNMYAELRPEIEALENILERDLHEWRI